MQRFSPYRFSIPLVAVAVLALGSCGGPSETNASGQAEGEPAAAESGGPGAKNTPPRPDTYVPYRCSVCSCRVFMGDGATCSRPSCEHPWSDHQSPLK